MGCDGIFDRLKSSEVFKCANIIIDKSRELLEKNIEYNNYFNTYYDKIINMHTTCGNVVDMILRLSMLRKSYDNVTCIMVAFKDLLYNNNSNFENSRDFKRKENIYENKPNLKNLSFGLHKAHLNKDINTINNENKEPQDNITNRRQYGNYRYLEDNDELDINKENKLRRKNNNSLDKEKEIENEIREGRERDKEIKNRRFIPSQSQEKKIRELISLFSMNNRKGNNNDSKFLYNSYNSTESLNNTKINSNNISNIEKGKDDDIPNNSRKAKIVFNQINNDSKKNNIYILKDSSNSKEEAELEDENNNFIAKRKKVLVLKKRFGFINQ